MSGAIKQPLILLSACLVNALLFLVIHQMVSKTPLVASTVQALNLIDFIRLQQAPEQIEQQRQKKIKPEPPPPPDKAPPAARVEPKTPQPAPMKMELPAPDIRLPSSLPGVPYTGDYLQTPAVRPDTAPVEAPALPQIVTGITPTVRIEPQYPARALRAGIEGEVTVEFTIAIDGSVKDIEIVAADPPQIFDKEVLKALKRWKFPPQSEGGRTVEKRARQDIRFTLRR